MTAVMISIVIFLASAWLFFASRGYFLHIVKRQLEITEFVKTNEKVVATNKQLLNKIEMGLFEAKEHGLFLYDHYAAMLDVLEQVAENDDYESLARASDITHDSLQNVVDNFYSTFGMTPDQWRAQRFKAKLLNRVTGRDEESQCSVN